MKVLVIGDSCEDIFQYGVCERLSPEAPIPVFKPTLEKRNWGMALNVYENLMALGIECDIVTNTERPQKKRYVEEHLNHPILRVDTNDRINPVDMDVLDGVDFDSYDAVAISDYNKGFLTKDVIQYITTRNPRVFIDSKKKLGDWCLKSFVIKINEKEYLQNRDFLKNCFSGNLIVTLGRKGAMLNHTEMHFGIENEHTVLDLSGAGDTFLAALVARYIQTQNLPEAIKFANKCASWVVTQKGVCIINLNRI